MLSDREFALFRKYLKGAILDGEDVDDVYELASTGLARIGFSTEIEEGVRETARLTPLGHDLYKRELILRNPIKKFFYSLVNV